MAVKAKLRANAEKVSFRISLQWPSYIINSVDKTKSSETDRSEISITFCNALIELNFNGKKNDDPSCFLVVKLILKYFETITRERVQNKLNITLGEKPIALLHKAWLRNVNSWFA